MPAKKDHAISCGVEDHGGDHTRRRIGGGVRLKPLLTEEPGISRVITSIEDELVPWDVEGETISIRFGGGLRALDLRPVDAVPFPRADTAIAAKEHDLFAPLVVSRDPFVGLRGRRGVHFGPRRAIPLPCIGVCTRWRKPTVEHDFLSVDVISQARGDPSGRTAHLTLEPIVAVPLPSLHLDAGVGGSGVPPNQNDALAARIVTCASSEMVSRMRRGCPLDPIGTVPFPGIGLDFATCVGVRLCSADENGSLAIRVVRHRVVVALRGTMHGLSLLPRGIIGDGRTNRPTEAQRTGESSHDVQTRP